MRNIKKFLKESFVNTLQRTARFFGYKIINIQTKIHPRFQNIIPFLFLKDPESFFFVQIGANDGKKNDPLHDFIREYKPNGVLVEPQVDVFERLKETYKGHKNLMFANVALATKDGEQSIHTVKKSFQPILNKKRKWGGDATALASFSKDQLKKSVSKSMGNFFSNDDIDNYITKEQVAALTFDSFVKTYSIKRIDLLQIDTEGYDYEIIKMVNFERFSPSVINYESKHLSEKEKIECDKLLRQKGYTVLDYDDDTLAFKI